MIDISKQYLLQLKKALPPELSDRELHSIFRILKEDLLEIPSKSSIPPQLTNADSNKFEMALKKLAEGMPVQYVVGKALFYERYFTVDKRVLIPRPETEELAFMILDRFPNDPKKVLDVGTGSGCLAITLAAERPAWQVVGLDIEKNAIELAIKNARNLETEVQFLVKDFFDKSVVELGEFDLIVSNPPYIAYDEKKDMDESVLQYEPGSALFVEGNDPLLFYKEILIYANKQRGRPVFTAFELNPKYVKDLIEWNVNTLNLQAEILKDLSGKERFLFCNI